MIGPMLRVLVVALVLLVAVMFAALELRRPLPAPENASYFETPLVMPEFRLEATTGEAYATSDLNGHFSLMFFGYTHCPDICPLTLAAIAGAVAELEAAGETPPEVVFVSVDPNRDTPEQIERYLGNFDSRFIGTTASRASLDPLLSALGVSVMVHAVAGQADYTVTHNGTIYVIGPDAELVATMSGTPPAATIATDFRRISALSRRRHATSDGA